MGAVRIDNRWQANKHPHKLHPHAEAYKEKQLDLIQPYCVAYFRAWEVNKKWLQAYVAKAGKLCGQPSLVPAPLQAQSCSK